MALKILALAFAASVFAEAKWYQKREATSTICDPINNITKIQCYCITDNHDQSIKSATCHLVKKNVQSNDHDWDAFRALENTKTITFSNTMGIAINYIPTKALSYTSSVIKLDIKYGIIEMVKPFAFANSSSVEEIILSSNQIKSLAVNAFTHHSDLTSLGLDTNEIVEINRDVFVDLPSLEKLFLTNNKITTIHDRAFMHLMNLKELEIDRNGLISLNSETFSGLNKLQRLDLSGNNLEVIGDNTFVPLTKLETLNLDGNKIQMLDEKAFYGLGKLTVLYLAHNNLTSIDNVKIFEGLGALKFLTLKSNQLTELKAEVMAPIMKNFYGNTSSLDVEENNFPCDCRLEWFMKIMNNTQNSQLKLAMENLKCNPDSKLMELWSKVDEKEKSDGKAFDEAEPQTNNEYEYYDDVQLNGKLFYVDVRDLINCTTPKNEIDLKNNDNKVITTTKAASSLDTTKPVTTTLPPKPVKEIYSTTVKAIEPKFVASTVKVVASTMRVAASTESVKFDHDNMASDEARTEKVTKTHRSIQDDSNDRAQHSNANKNVGAVAVLVAISCFSLYF